MTREEVLCDKHKGQQPCNPRWQVGVYTCCSPALPANKRCGECATKSKQELEQNFGSYIVRSCFPIIDNSHMDANGMMCKTPPHNLDND